MEQLLLIKNYNDFFTNFEGVAGVKIFDRYDALIHCIQNELPEHKNIFSKPIFEGDDVKWYVPFYKNTPIIWSEYNHPTKNSEFDLLLYKFNKVILELVSEGKHYEAELISKAIKHINLDFLYIIDGKPVFGVWGMQIRDEFIQSPTGKVVFNIFKEKKPKQEEEVPKIISSAKCQVQFYAKENGQLSGKTNLEVEKGEFISNGEIPEPIPHAGYEFKDWDQDPCAKSIENSTSFVALFSPKSYQIEFNSNYPSFLNHPNQIQVPFGTLLNENHVPNFQIPAGYRFLGWSENPINHKVEGNHSFYAKFDKEKFQVSFLGSEHGTIDGNSFGEFEHGSTLREEHIPTPTPKEGYTFKGWNIEPNNHIVTQNQEFVAEYERIPWYLRLWNWLTGSGCLKWLLWFLLFLLILWLLSLIPGCHRVNPIHWWEGEIERERIDTRYPNSNPNPNPELAPDGPGIYDEDPYSTVPSDPSNPNLPPNQQELPPIDQAPIVRNPDGSRIIGNRLNILMSNDNHTISELSTAFKNKYPGNQYKVVYYDETTKRMQIEIPTDERESIKARIPGQFKPEYDLFVFDESLFEGNAIPNDPYLNKANCRNYLNQIQMPQSWQITTGNKDVIVAVVDNGFNLSHPEFSGPGKIVKPYNVIFHSRNVNAQSSDHGTHVAGIAVGNKNNGSGLCGIAPDCKLMPVQVAYPNGLMTTTSILDGILYSIYQGADVVNVSLGRELPSGLPEAVQKDWEKNHFKEEERLWNEIMRIANLKNSTVVIAAGNENLITSVDPLKRNKNFIVVSSIDRNGKKSTFSNYGTYSTISAPGEDIMSSYGNSYKALSGTSMAAPIVAGSVALIKSLNKNLKTEEIICILQSTGKSGNTKIGKTIQLHDALLKVKNNDLSFCSSNTENRIPSSGDVQVLAKWNNTNDLDIAVIDPGRNKIWHGNKKSPTGGCLEIDMNVYENGSNNPIENIFWPTGKAPKGTYQVLVELFRQHNNNVNNPYTLLIKYGDKEEKITGTIKKSDGQKKVFQFTLN